MLYTTVNDTGRTAYCGPTAIAALTGLPISATEDLIRRTRKGWRNTKQPVRGVLMREACKVLERLGCKLERMHITEVSLGKFIADTEHVALPMMVSSATHVCVVHKGKCSDSFVRSKSRIQHAWIVKVPPVIKYVPLAARPKIEKPKPTKCDLAIAKLAQVEQRRKWWLTKHKRAETAIRKLNESIKYYQTRIAQLSV